jgi:hypothetical protein
MARMRTVKPEFFDDEELAIGTSRDARLLYIGLWTQADEHSRVRGNPNWIKGQVYPYDEDITAAVVDVLIDELVSLGKVVRYTSGGASYLYLRRLARHQRLDTAKVPSRLPPPPDPNESGKFPDESAPDSDESGRDPDESGNGADSSETRARSSVLKHVASSRLHAAGSARGKIPDETRRHVTDATDATDDEADALIAAIAADRQPRNLPAFIRTLARDGDLPGLLANLRAEPTQPPLDVHAFDPDARSICQHGGQCLWPPEHIGHRSLRAVADSA